MLNTIHNKVDDRGVSPVIGVILMVAITVILAAVIGSFVLGIGGDVEATPTASLSLENESGLLTIAHEGGDTLDGSEILISNGTANDTFSGNLAPGEEVTDVGPDDKFVQSGVTIRVVHEPSGGIIARADF